VEDKASAVSEHSEDGGKKVGDALKDAKDAVKDTVKKLKEEIKKADRRK